ncbi:hypothetical protein FOA43_002462 [Brettanomyces nanus]|uniref:NADP-dependent oxidoreductase domain-containing protein n=1 Tax=Eeniella nana TaxID=13502 RepID=A0A875S5U2_EENNA|nr:uncharacterized protein FOA43_002462 [Brettanomyces nanus]QPG75119.1 hypothetical protein FOA43_002462 [Brettanomyces nanus]
MSYVTVKGPTGYGLMSLTWRPTPLSQQQCFDVINYALDQGVTFFNSGEFYGNNDDKVAGLKLLKAYFEKYPENRARMTICVKGSCRLDTMMPDNSKEYLVESVENICSFFPDGKLDLFEPARLDLVHPIEETITNLVSLVNSGKIGGIALSEVSADSIRRAYKVFPHISYVEEEFSMMSTTILHDGVNDACRDLGIPIVAYSPLGRGYLTGTVKSMSDIPQGDIRRYLGRFNSDEILKANFSLVELVGKMAKKKNVTEAQIALAWIRKHNQFPEKYATYIPIPSASTVLRMKENLEVIELTDEEFDELNKGIEGIEVKGWRYNEMAEHFLEV